MEITPLKRKWARVSIVLLSLGGALVVAGLLLEELSEWVFGVSTDGLCGLGRTLVVLGLLVWFLTGRCPHCGKHWVIPLAWSYEAARYCPRCGRTVPFDDGPQRDPGPPPERRQRLGVSRGWARLTLALLAASGVCFLGALFIALFLEPLLLNVDSVESLDLEGIWRLQDLRANLVLLSIVPLAAGLYLNRRHLRCPNCGKGAARPWQRRTRWCWNCGAALAFRDELEREPSPRMPD